MTLTGHGAAAPADVLGGDPHVRMSFGKKKVYARQLGRVYKRELKEYFEVLRQHQLVKASADEIEEFSAYWM